MFFAIVKNDLLQMLRDRKAMLVTMLMPFVLITILGFSLSGVMNIEDIPVNASIGIVSEQDAKKELVLFQELLDIQEMPQEVKITLMEVATQLEPEKLLTEYVFKSEELKQYIQVSYMELDEAKTQIKNNELTAAIVFEEHFSSHMLENVLLEKKEPSELIYIVNEQQEMNAGFVKSVIDSVFNQLTFDSTVGKMSFALNGVQPTNVISNETLFTGEMKPVEGAKVISSFMYYTLGMGVMFALFTASYGAIYAFYEKETHVYERLLLANVPAYQYLISKWISTTVFAFLQISILIGLSGFIYQVPWTNIAGMTVIILCYSIAIGAITPFLTALNFRFGSTNASSIFMSGGVSLIALLGGSFLPMSQLPEKIENIGNYTINGATLRAQLLLQQGYSLVDSLEYIFILFISICLILFAAFILFPKEETKI